MIMLNTDLHHPQVGACAWARVRVRVGVRVRARVLASDRVLNSDLTMFLEEATTGCLSDFLLISLGWCLDVVVGELLIGIDGIHHTATVYHT